MTRTRTIAKLLDLIQSFRGPLFVEEITARKIFVGTSVGAVELFITEKGSVVDIEKNQEYADAEAAFAMLSA